LWGGYLFLNLALHGLAAECYAADISKGALKVTSKKLLNFGLTGFFIECDCENLPLKDNSFDMITGNGVLHHLPDMEKALGEIKRVLKPGGVAVFLHEPNKRGNEICYAIIKGISLLHAVFVRFLRRISKKEVTHRLNVHPTDVYPYSYQFEQIAKNIGFSEVFTETEGFTWCIIREAILPIFNYTPREFSVLLKPMYKELAHFNKTPIV
jgi:ubiquinone/menaquinone biosynthesis C-methylase UbiE